MSQTHNEHTGNREAIGCCIICGDTAGINTVAQFDERGNWVGVVFACPMCILPLSNGNIIWLPQGEEE